MTHEDELKLAVNDAARREDVRASVQQIYADLRGEIDRRAPLCVVSGKCCRFEDYGHRLYVTTMELATFVNGLRRVGTAHHESRPVGNAHPTEWDGTGCPFQQNKLCSVHAIRPFGCRIFFCDPTATDWQNAQYERFHSTLKRLHETLNVPYFYVEWRHALRVLFDEP